MALAPQGLASLANSYITIGNASMDYNLNTANSVTFTNSVNGFPNVFGGAYGNASDRAFKQNIAPVTDGLALTMKLKPSTYEMIDTGLPSLGFIAQDVQEILPALVTTVTLQVAENEEPVQRLALNYDGIIPVLTHAIQELSAQVTALSATVAALQAPAQASAAAAPATATGETTTP
jgi:hypothetical protein